MKQETRGSYLLVTLVLCLTQGCASLTSAPFEYRLDSFAEIPKISEDDKCAEMANHVLAITGRGEYKPISFANADCRPTTLDTNERPEYEDDVRLDAHLDKIFKGVKERSKSSKNGRVNLLIFIHGGMNTYGSSVERAARDVEAIMNDTADNYYPVFFIWPSGPFDSYGDSLGSYDQGEWIQWRNPRYLLTMPFKVVTDTAEIGARALSSYAKQINMWAGAGCFNEKYRTWLWMPWYCGITDREGPSIATPSETLRRDTDPANDPCEQRETPRGFTCLKQDPETASAYDWNFARLAQTALFPLKAVSTPLIDPLGERAWKSMISRTRFAFRRPCKGDPWSKGDCSNGVVYRFFEKLEQKLEEKRKLKDLSHVDITIVGHSMGAIVASEIINQFSELPYKNVVFLGAAVSIREYKNTVERVLRSRVARREALYKFKQRILDSKDSEQQGEWDRLAADLTSQPFNFYSLSLHPYAEAREENVFGAAPSGSLLEWIDGNFEIPADISDRTLGRWANLAAVWEILDHKLLGTYAHFKRFDLKATSPRKHGELAQSWPRWGNYWRDKYWR